MKVLLLYDRPDVVPLAPVLADAETAMDDLELGIVLDTMAAGDPLILEQSRRALCDGLADPCLIEYRQEILADCLANPEPVWDLYALALEGVRSRRKVWWVSSGTPDAILHGGTQRVELYVEVLRRVREVIDRHGSAFRSPGMSRLFQMLTEELSDDFLTSAQEHLDQLKFRHGVLISARLEPGNAGTDYVLRHPNKRTWAERIAYSRASHHFDIHPRDDAGFQVLGELRDRGVNLVADAIAQSADHLEGFFQTLASELAFYVGVINLYERLESVGARVCTPRPGRPGSLRLTATGLYDVALCLRLGRPVVGNAIEADGKRLVVITGANQGGKSTFLRALGQAQVMMQAGMFVAAEAFRADIRPQVFTHFKREEDPTMVRGKLDEELNRMRAIVERLSPGGLVLSNESFASTNEQEGSEIARQVFQAMIDAGVKVVVVTHLYDFAHGLYEQGSASTLFLLAERRPDGTRTYKLYPGEPLPLSFGRDTYLRVFGTDLRPQPSGSSSSSNGWRCGPR